MAPELEARLLACVDSDDDERQQAIAAAALAGASFLEIAHLLLVALEDR